MHHEHQRQAQVRHHHEAAQLEDVFHVRAGHHLGHQRHYAIRGQLHHHPHQAHHPGLQGVDGRQRAFAFLGIVLDQLQRGQAEEDGKDNHADDRGRLGPCQVTYRVAGDERQQQLRDVEVGDLAGVVAVDNLHARAFLRAGHQAFGAQAEQVGQDDADQRGDGGGQQQGTNAQHADAAQRRGIVQARHGTEDRGEDQRHDDHLQQADVAVADQVEPGDGGLEHRVASTIDGMQYQAEHHAQHQAQQYFSGQAPVGAAGLCQAQQQGQERQQVKGQWQVH